MPAQNADHDEQHELIAATIAPDLGERYLNTIYQPNWLQDVYGEDMLHSNERNIGSQLPDRQHTAPLAL